VDLKEVAAKYDSHWNSLSSQIDGKPKLWSLEPGQAVKVAKRGEEWKFEKKAELLQNENVTTIRDAVDALNTYEGHVACPEGFCVVFSPDIRRPGSERDASKRMQLYFLLTRSDINVDIKLLPEIQPAHHEANQCRIMGQRSRMGKDTWSTLEGWSRCCKGSPWTLKQIYAEIEADIHHVKARDSSAKRGRLPPELLGMGTTQERRPKIPFHRFAGFGASGQSSTQSSQMRSTVSLPALTVASSSNE
jgi:hypothetical protein